jgi:hypothetical protein
MDMGEAVEFAWEEDITTPLISHIGVPTELRNVGSCDKQR